MIPGAQHNAQLIQRSCQIKGIYAFYRKGQAAYSGAAAKEMNPRNLAQPCFRMAQQSRFMSLPPVWQLHPVFQRRRQAHRTGDIGGSRLQGWKKCGFLCRDPLHHAAAIYHRRQRLFAIEQPNTKGSAQFMPGADIIITVQRC